MMEPASLVFHEGPEKMYDAISDFLRDLSDYSRPLWTLFVLGMVTTLSLALYAFWETTLTLIRAHRGRKPGVGSGPGC